MTVINWPVAKWFEARGIAPSTVTAFGIYTGRRDGGIEGAPVVPDASGNVIVFPYVRAGVVVGEKYRTADKRFWSKAGCKKSFFNADVLDEPALISGEVPLVIVEGEMDALAVRQAGYHWVVSVPNGGNAGSGPVPEGTADIEPQNDEAFSYIWDDIERLQQVKWIVLATDADPVGHRLRAELARRLDPAKCLTVEFPEGCKDFNDSLLKSGPKAVVEAIDAAAFYPVSGAYRLDELPPEPQINPLSTGWQSLDRLIRPYFPSLVVIAGLANAGKSTFTNQLLANLVLKHGLKIALGSFEMALNPFVTDVLGAVALDKRADKWTAQERDDARRWIQENFYFIFPSPDDPGPHDLEWFLERARVHVIRHNIRVVAIDPWNELAQSRLSGESGTDYVGRALKMIKDFGRRFGCMMIVVSHPAKGATDKKSGTLTLYDIADSAHFANKADLGVIISKPDRAGTVTEVNVVKVRYQPSTGTIGTQELVFDRARGIFYG